MTVVLLERDHPYSYYTMSRIFVCLLLLFTLNAFSAELYENVQMIQVRPEVFLETTIFKPPGAGPFPLVIMNHGKDLGDPRGQGRVVYKTLAKEFFKRGYAVILPMRRGFSKSTGPYADDECDLTTNGQHQGQDITDILNYFTRQPWVNPDQIIVAGQSYGGLATMGFGTTNYPGVKLLINFAGGLKFSWGCDWQPALVTAFGIYGMTTKIPSLWFYGINDSFFGPELADKMYDAYTKSGGPATIIKFGPFKADAHGLAGWTDGPLIYWPSIEKFLLTAGLPIMIRE